MSEDRRKTYRYPVGENAEPAVLHRRGRKWRVTLTEKSAGGFRVVCPTDVRLSPGDSAMLETSVACSTVRIAHITPGEDGVVIGLQLIHDSSGVSRSAMSGDLKGALQSALLVVVGAVAVAIVGVFIFGDREALMARLEDWRQGAHTQTGAAGPDPRRATESASLGHGFTRPVGLSTERFCDELQLTGRQQAQIDQIVGETAAALRTAAADRSSEPGQWSDAGVQIVRQSWQRLQSVLSAEQQQRWNELASPSGRPLPDQQALAR